MDKSETDDLLQALREQRVQYVVGTQGEPVAVLLPIEEFTHYLDLLDDEADCQDEELSVRLRQAAAQPAGGERQSFRDYLRTHETPRAQVQG